MGLPFNLIKIDYMKKIGVEIVQDSINKQGDRIISFLATYPRFIHSELMTHRMFSRNSASSRAIPFNKMVKQIEECPFIPIAWQKDHKGMQGSAYITDEKLINRCKEGWLHAKDNAVERACELHGDNWIEPENKHLLLDVTKQLCNRLLEPFMWHTVLVTTTELDNFFELRCPQYINPNEKLSDTDNIVFRSRKDYEAYYGKQNFTEEEWWKISKSPAEIHIQALAESLWDAVNESKPKVLEPGEWHIPFGDMIDFVGNRIEVEKIDNTGFKDYDEQNKVKIATARCARLSYMTFDGKIDYQKDIELHDRLLKSKHMSPFEHCARAMTDDEYKSFIKFVLSEDGRTVKRIPGWCNNFRGFIQYRYMVENNWEAL
jgi:hypothetical protein